MKFSLVGVASAVATAWTAAEEAVVAFNQLKEFTVQMMHQAEMAFAESKGAGQTKLTAVLAAVEAVAKSMGIMWTAVVADSIAQFITASKSAYNAVSAVTAPQVAAQTTPSVVLPGVSA